MEVLYRLSYKGRSQFKTAKIANSVSFVNTQSRLARFFYITAVREILVFIPTIM